LQRNNSGSDPAALQRSISAALQRNNSGSDPAALQRSIPRRCSATTRGLTPGVLGDPTAGPGRRPLAEWPRRVPHARPSSAGWPNAPWTRTMAGCVRVSFSSWGRLPGGGPA